MGSLSHKSQPAMRGAGRGPQGRKEGPPSALLMHSYARAYMPRLFRPASWPAPGKLGWHTLLGVKNRAKYRCTFCMHDV